MRSRPPSVNALALSLSESGLPHPLCVDVARAAIAAGDPASAPQRARELQRSLLTPVVNATGVILHTNLGRAPLAYSGDARPMTVEFDLATGERGSRQRAVGQLFARLCGAESAMVVNNNAGAVLLVAAALAAGREVVVSRGESVEIGGSFRVPDVISQSGARLVDVGLKIHPSNYRVSGFVEETTVGELASLEVPVVADIGSGLIDASTPWLAGPPPSWLAGEPAAVQCLADGADLVTFSGDKLLGGPQAGIIAGRADLVERCARHPLARALRCGVMVLSELQRVALAYLHREVVDQVPWWAMATASVEELTERAERIVAAAGVGRVVATEAIPGAGSAPGVTIPSVGIVVDGDRLAELRAGDPAVIARTRDGATTLDLRSVNPDDDAVVVDALSRLER